MVHATRFRYFIIAMVSLYIHHVIYQDSYEAQSLNYNIETDAMVTSTAADEVWLTVFVHGTIVLHPRFLLENIPALKHDKADQTLYGQVLHDSRSTPLLLQNQAIQQLGLQKINEPFNQRGNTAGALAYILQELQYSSDSSHKTCNYYYTFGWSGLISESTREQAGADLYHELGQEIAAYEAKGISPKIRVIGYSHGGSVCLNIARAATDEKWHIDELILLGAPIQPTTDYLIASPLFKKSYIIFSHGDSVQMHDFFSPHFSRRYFKGDECFELPDNLTQIQLRMAKNISHEYSTAPREHSFFYRRALSPGHIELWFFGWTPNYYRKRYPLYPLPTVAFIPYIVKQVQQHVVDHNPARPLIVTIAPDQEIMSIALHEKDKCPTIVPFVCTDMVDSLAQTMLADYKPHNYKKAYYQERDKIIKESIKRHMQKRPTAACTFE